MNPNQGKEKVGVLNVVDAFWRDAVLYVTYTVNGGTEKTEQFFEADMWGNDSEPRGRG